MKKVVSTIGLSVMLIGSSMNSGFTTEALAQGYSVQKGDTIYGISKENGVSIADLMRWNNLHSPIINIGQNLHLSEQSQISTVKTHIVKKGETLYGIAKKYSINISNLKKINGLTSDHLKIGQTLKVSSSFISNPTPMPTPEPIKGTIHTVKKGETLYSISKKYKVSIAELKSSNGLISNVLRIGQVLKVSTTNTPIEPPVNQPSNPKDMKVKGVYMSGYLASVDSKYNELVRLVDNTELNSLVIDVKMDGGQIVFDSSVPLANQTSSDKQVNIKDMKQKMKTLEQKNIYTIARIVTFKDPLIAKKRTDLAMKKKDGSLYYDNGIPWIDPYKKEYWEYVVSISKEAALIGFDEIQFDYVRFPTNGSYVDKVVKFDNKENKTKAENIRDFLLYAKKELKPFGVTVSADIFGIAMSTSGDSGIGHHWGILTQAVDVMSPMMYPSHYGPGVYGIPVPDANPYLTIKRGFQYAIEREKTLHKQGKPVAEIRPWFQDFTATNVKGHITYGPKQVNDQIRAAKEFGVEEFLLWNPKNQYSEGAFK